MGFYQSMFFRTWLVVAQNVASPRGTQGKVEMIVSAGTAEDACEKVRRYLAAEGFTFGPVAAYFG